MDMMMKNQMNGVKWVSCGLLCCVAVGLMGCGKDKKKKNRHSGGSSQQAAEVVKPVVAPTMDDARVLDAVLMGVVVEVVSEVRGRLEMSTGDDELMGEVTGKHPRLRCMVPAGQPIYKITFEPADGSLGTQRTFFTETAQKKVYIQISSGGAGKQALTFKRQTMPF